MKTSNAARVATPGGNESWRPNGGWLTHVNVLRKKKYEFSCFISTLTW